MFYGPESLGGVSVDAGGVSGVGAVWISLRGSFATSDIMSTTDFGRRALSGGVSDTNTLHAAKNNCSGAAKYGLIKPDGSTFMCVTENRNQHSVVPANAQDHLAAAGD